MEMPTHTQLPDTLSWPAIGSWIVVHRAPFGSGTPDCRSGLRYHFDRRLRKAFLSSLRLGSNAEPRAFADSPSGPRPCADERAERIDRQKRKPNPGTNRAAVLAGREFRSLPPSFESDRADHRLYRKQPGFCQTGVLSGELALVQRGLAGETACPTNGQQCTGLECRNSSGRLSPAPRGFVSH